jgi:hypothetical protein
MSVKPVKIVTNLQVNKEIIKVDENGNSIFRISGSLNNGFVSSSLPITASAAYISGNLFVTNNSYLYGTSSLANIGQSLLINNFAPLRIFLNGAKSHVSNFFRIPFIILMLDGILYHATCIAVGINI